MGHFRNIIGTFQPKASILSISVRKLSVRELNPLTVNTTEMYLTLAVL